MVPHRPPTVPWRREVAGEAIEIIRSSDFARPTFFVEDDGHVLLLETIANCFGISITVSPCNNSSNVKSLFRLSEQDGGWPNAWFMIDGDNEGNPMPGKPNFIHLPVYCAENYLIAPNHLSAISERTTAAIQETLLKVITSQRSKVLKNNKFFGFLFDLLRADQMTFENLAKLDASVIVDEVASSLGTTKSALMAKTIRHLSDTDKLSSFFPASLMRPFLEARAQMAG